MKQWCALCVFLYSYLNYRSCLDNGRIVQLSCRKLFQFSYHLKHLTSWIPFWITILFIWHTNRPMDIRDMYPLITYENKFDLFAAMYTKQSRVWWTLDDTFEIEVVIIKSYFIKRVSWSWWWRWGGYDITLKHKIIIIIIVRFLKRACKKSIKIHITFTSIGSQSLKWCFNCYSGVLPPYLISTPTVLASFWLSFNDANYHSAFFVKYCCD